jgi:hypothetical protein
MNCVLLDPLKRGSNWLIRRLSALVAEKFDPLVPSIILEPIRLLPLAPIKPLIPLPLALINPLPVSSPMPDDKGLLNPEIVLIVLSELRTVPDAGAWNCRPNAISSGSLCWCGFGFPDCDNISIACLDTDVILLPTDLALDISWFGIE